MGNWVSKREDGAEISIQSFISWSEIIGESREEDIPRAEDQEPPADSCNSDSNPAYALSTGGATTSLSGEVQVVPRTPEPPVDHDSNPAAYSPRVADSESITTGGAGATNSLSGEVQAAPRTPEPPVDHDSNPAAYSPRVSDSESTGGAGATNSFSGEITVPITQETPITDHPGPDQEITPEERREWGRIIATALRDNYVQLIKTIDVQEAAHCLFEAWIVTDNEHEMAVTTGYESSQTRAGKLIAILIKRVEANPHQFKAVCQALEQAGAESIIDEIKAEVQRKKTSSSKATSEGSGEQLKMQCVGGSDHSPPQSSELPGCFTETELNIAPSPLHIICGAIPKDTNEVTRKKRKDDLAELQRQLNEGANCGCKDEDGNTPLHIATSRGDTEVVCIILSHIQRNGPVDVINYRNNEFQTVLHISTMNNFPGVTSLVCEQMSCTFNMSDKAMRTPLHYACSSGVLDSVKPLLKCCSNERFVNATDENGDTALHLATRSGFTEIMKLLRKNKADLKITNHDNKSPIDIAHDCLPWHPKPYKVLTKPKYGRISLPWPKRNASKMRNSSSSSGISSRRSESTNSVSSFASKSSTCSEIARYSSKSKKT